MTIQELNQLYFISKEINKMQQELINLETGAYSVSYVLSDMPRGSSVIDKVGNYSSEIADLKTLIGINMNKYLNEKNKLERFINSIDDSQLRLIIRLRFINRYTWLKIAFEIGANDEAYPRMKLKRYLNKRN